jgi:hypothetical protein
MAQPQRMLDLHQLQIGWHARGHVKTELDR